MPSGALVSAAGKIYFKRLAKGEGAETAACNGKASRSVSITAAKVPER
jgi:hypothetical protein